MNGLKFAVLPLLMFVMSVSLNAETGGEWRALGGMPADQANAQIATKSEAQKKALATEIKAAASSPSFWSVYDVTLLQLGDEETIKRYRGIIISGNAREKSVAFEVISAGADLRTIEAIAPGLFHIGDENLSASYPIAYQAILAILKVTGKSSGLDPKVYRWLDQIKATYGYYAVPAMRKWWTENEERFKKGEFAKVLPGEEVPPPEAVEPYEDANGKQAMRLRPDSSWKPTAITQTESVVESKVAPSPTIAFESGHSQVEAVSAEKRLTNRWIFVVGVLVLFAAAVLVGIRTRAGRKS